MEDIGGDDDVGIQAARAWEVVALEDRWTGDQVLVLDVRLMLTVHDSVALAAIRKHQHRFICAGRPDHGLATDRDGIGNFIEERDSATAAHRALIGDAR